jgi:hypothetical protein
MTGMIFLSLTVSINRLIPKPARRQKKGIIGMRYLEQKKTLKIMPHKINTGRIKNLPFCLFIKSIAAPRSAKEKMMA